MSSVLAALPEPHRQPLVGHLGRWGLDPLTLLEEGAALGGTFRLRLWRPVVVGYRPHWNRAVLRDLDAFRSAGSLSVLTPYLDGGVVTLDAPAHRGRRHALNPHLRTVAIRPLEPRLVEIADRILPTGEFETLQWAGGTVRAMLNEVLFGSRMDDRLLSSFLDPLHLGFPHPFLPRRRLFARMDRAIRQLLADPAPGGLTSSFAGHANAAEELRVSLAAGYDTTAHTLAWALWHLAAQPEWREVEALSQVVDEVLRLYPAGWVGSRVTSREVTVDEISIPAKTMVFYSPFLTHRDPALWADPLRFDPERFDGIRPAWRFVPFGAGERTCLGAHLARLMLRAALTPFCRGGLLAVDGDPMPKAGLTLRPRGPLMVRRTAPRQLSIRAVERSAAR